MLQNVLNRIKKMQNELTSKRELKNVQHMPIDVRNIFIRNTTILIQKVFVLLTLFTVLSAMASNTVVINYLNNLFKINRKITYNVLSCTT